MSPEGADRQQLKAHEFMGLLPLTAELAGLPRAEAGHYYTESRLLKAHITIATAFKIARQIVLDVTK